MGAAKRLGRRPARSHDQARPFVRHIARLKPGILDRLRHRDEVERGAIPHEPQVTLLDMVGKDDVRRPMHLTAKAVLGIVGGKGDAGFSRT
jgi:hypothetical protein